HVASTRHCENMIGVTQVPLGIAGPLRVHDHDYYIPLATTEGALVASVNRGCKALTQSGGVMVQVEKVGATRGPVFFVESVEERKKFIDFLSKNFSELKKIAESTSGHLRLLSYETVGCGRYQYVRFIFDTTDAMGLNMVTIATTAITSHIEKTIGIRCLAISGNFCVDKKPSWQNFINRRGYVVHAESAISSTILRDVLKVSAQAVYKTWMTKCMLGSALSGSLGYNAQYANIIAALFIATGQDPAHVVEGSMGITTTEIIESQKDDADLYVSVYLPSLMVGTVGGGTGLATQREALSILGIRGGNDGENARIFAGIVGASVLAGEISLLASLAEGTLSKAHERLARGKNV
ncbi:MAG: hydroxymethylglutaryl-CoA reductase, partial [Patescibacteria group bacterium]|nr:hydroxymethylglutaryl-CoA reductase [Patescibacteria group bacterium]